MRSSRNDERHCYIATCNCIFVQLKYLVVIPMLILFTGQLPVFRSLQLMMVIQKAEKPSCCSRMKMMDCKKQSAQAEKHSDQKNTAKGCCEKMESRCASLLSFQFNAVVSSLNDQNSFAIQVSKQDHQYHDGLRFMFYPVITPPPDCMI